MGEGAVTKGNKEKLQQTAQKYISKGLYKKAIGEYEKIVKEDPEDIRARLKLADLYFKQKELDRAVQTFMECAGFYEKQGFMQKAVAVYKQVIGIVPDRPELYTALAGNYQKLGLLNEAAAQLGEALKVLETRGDQAAKLGIIRQMLDLDPDNLPDRIRLAEAYSKLGKNLEAVRELRKVADALDKAGDSRSFERIAERLLYHQPDDAAMAKKLATSYLDAEQPQRALPKLKIAYKQSSQDVETLEMVARSFEQLGQLHKAVTVLRELARVYGKSGLEAERDECYSRILNLDPTDESAREALGETGEAAGDTIEFDNAEVRARSGAKVPTTPPAPPRAPSHARVPTTPPAPPRAPSHARVPTGPVAPPAAVADDSELDDMIAAASGLKKAAAPVPPAPRPAPRPAAPPVAKAPPPKAVVPAKAADDLDWDDDDDDDDVGFGEGTGEQTMVDNLFIPPDVLKKVQDGLDWAKPSEDTAGPELDKDLREELRELDFYIKNGLKDEALVLVGELKQKYGNHPSVSERASQVAGMA